MKKQFIISDISFASFLVLEGHEISQVSRRGRKVLWVFDLTDDDMSTAEAKWPSCESAKFYSIYQTLKTHIKVPKNANKATNTQH